MSLTTRIFIALTAFMLLHHLRPGGHGGGQRQAPNEGGSDGSA